MYAKDIGYQSLLDYASGTAARTSAALDMANHQWAILFVKFAVIAAGATTSIKAQQSSDDGSSDAYADLAGTAIAVAADDDNQTFAIVIEKPRERYLKLVVGKDGANAAAEMAWAIFGGGRVLPELASVTDALTIEQHISPAEGTA